MSSSSMPLMTNIGPTLQAMQAIKQQQPIPQQQQQQQPSVKKKFGKNLTKLVQSQQQVTPTDIRTSSSTSTNRNGLLLLSTNKKSSGLLASSVINDTTGPGGLLTLSSSGSAPARDVWGVSNTNAGNSKNHQATTTIASVASTSSDVSNLEELQKRQQAVSKIESTKTTDESTAVLPDKPEKKADLVPLTNIKMLPMVDSDNLKAEESPKQQSSAPHPMNRPASEEPYEAVGKSAPGSSASWDEYGGRERGARVQASDIEVVDKDSIKIVTKIIVDADREYMSAKAKERAALIQKAEQERVLEQRNRAAARLQELNQNHNSSNEHKSSAVSGHLPHQNHDTVHHQQEPPPAAPPALIHLNGYEDRDRGLSNQSSQPRMLFDPKSGSMVAVKARDEQANSKAKKSAKKTQDVKGPGNKSSGRQQIGQATKESTQSDRKTRKNSDADIPVKLQLLKNTNPTVETAKAKKPAPPPQPVITHTRRSLPRTCGVLYTRSKIGIPGSSSDGGTMYCADGCEGDLGYGAHSVPGGRTRNPVAYAKHRQQMQHKTLPHSPSMFRNGAKHQNQTKNGVHDHWESDEMTMDQKGYSRTRVNQTHAENNAGKFTAGNRPPALLYTGFNPSQVLDNANDDYEHSHQYSLEWVTANDKLELVGMDDDEPTLKPTAKAFAPSQAALAAAATLRTQDSMCSDDDDLNSNDMLMGVGYDDNLDDDDDYDDDDIDDHHHQTVNQAAMNILEEDDFMEPETNVVGLHNHHTLLGDADGDSLGLGFDPTHDIAELIQKSSKSSTSRLVQLEELPLEPAILVSPFSSTLRIDNVATSTLHEEAVNANKFGSPSHNIFGFGSSDPWSTSASTNPALVNNAADWEVDILGLNSVGLVNTARNNNSNGLFSATDNTFRVTGLVTGITTTGGSWGSAPNGFDGMILNGEASSGPGNQGED